MSFTKTARGTRRVPVTGRSRKNILKKRQDRLKDGRKLNEQLGAEPKTKKFIRTANGIERVPVAHESPKDILKECHNLHQDVHELNEQLAAEMAKSFSEQSARVVLTEQLDRTTNQWRRQKTLKEMYINRGKETKRELERLVKYSNPETLNTAKIATQARNTAKRKKKRDLQVDYEELQVAQIISEEKFTADLQAEKEKNKTLQEELDRMVSHQEVSPTSDTYVISVRQQVETLQCELSKQVEQKNTLLKYYQDLQEAYVTIQQKFTTELLQEREKNKLLQGELEKITVSHREVSQRYEADVMTARQQVDTLQRAFEKELQHKTRLQKHSKELQEACTLSQEKLTTALQQERVNNKLLQEELERTKVSYQEISQKYETDLITAGQQADTLQRELDKEIKSHAVTVSEGWRVINTLRAEQDTLRQKMAEEMNTLQQNVGREVEELKTQLNDQISLNLQLSTELEAEREDGRPPRKKARREEMCEDEPWKMQGFLLFPPPNTPVITPLKEAQVALESTEEAESTNEKLPETTHTTSMWRRTRQFLGIKNWKK